MCDVEIRKDKLKVCWERKGANQQGPSSAYDGIPFVHIGEKVLWCHQGKDKHEKSKQKNKEKAQHCQVTVVSLPQSLIMAA